ncbi:MAG: hypothetical protein WA687_12825 [Solirubrobacterales bacterium]
MHRSIRKLLPEAVGESQLVVAANVDVRGFTRFSETQDSVLALLYIRKIYERILSDYFENASFFKLTGDGLLLVFPWTDKTLREVVRSVIADSLKLVVDFPNLLTKDPAIEFKVPSDVGIGLARGAASRLRSRNKTLDYSGRPLNVASRLMDLARPGGIVTDTNFGLSLLTKSVRDKFETNDVYVPGLAEREPMRVYSTSGYTKIPPKAQQPIVPSDWERIRETMEVRGLRDRGPIFTYLLPSSPVNPSEISAELNTPLYASGKPIPDVMLTYPIQFEYELDAGKPALALRYDTALAMIRMDKIPWARSVTLHIDYTKTD